jgi:hypothetical protein
MGLEGRGGGANVRRVVGRMIGGWGVSVDVALPVASDE